jgi:hypothetical protein
VLAPRLTRNARLQRTAQELPHAGQSEQPIGERWTVSGRAFEQDRTRGAFQLGGRHQPIHQATLKHAIGPQRLAGEHQLHGLANAQQPHRAHRTAKARMDPELHFGKPHRQAAVVGGDAIATGQRQLESATERKAGYGRDRRAGQGFELIENPLAGADMFEGVGGVAKGRELANVRAGNEAGALAGADQ